jgi:alcohol dehydrogenase
MKFSYHVPTKLVFGFDSLSELGKEAKPLGGDEAFVVTDKVMVKTGIFDKVKNAAPGLKLTVFDEVEAEPRIEVAQAVADAARDKHFDLVIGVGGGSSMDMAKVAAGFATNQGKAEAFVGNDRFEKRPVPSLMIPTTAGTGAELTVTSMVTVDGHKQWINSPLLLPAVAIVDPGLTLSMPKPVTAATGMDALCHNTEAYLSSLANPMTDSAALEGVSLVAANLEKAFDDGTDLRAREGMSLGALLGGVALQAKMVYGHSIGYTLAGRFGMAHGVSCGIPLAYIVAAYSTALGPRMKKLAEAYGIDSTADPSQMGVAIGEKVRELTARIGIPKTLRELGVKEEDLEGLASECIDMYPRPNSPLVFDKKSMAALYRRMWAGDLSERAN